jgi:hypothetical protein
LDFGDIHNAPVSFKLKGVEYTVPLFRLPALVEWTAKVKREKADFATAHLLGPPDKKGEYSKAGMEAKARYLTYWQPPPIDTMEMVQREVSPEGIDYVLRYALAKASPPMPAELIEELIAFGNPTALRELADRVTLNRETQQRMSEEGEGKDPLPQSPPASEGSPETGGSSADGSSQAVPEAKATSPSSAT